MMALRTASLVWASCTSAFVYPALVTEATAMLHLTKRRELSSHASDLALPVVPQKYLFMSQGAGTPPEWLKKVALRNDSAAMWGYFDTAHQSESLNISEIYMPGTTWTTGRNMLYQTAVDLQIRQNWMFEYLIFADEDAEIFFFPLTPESTVDVYSVFLAALSNTQPAVGSVRCKAGRGELESVVAPCSPDFDGIFSAFHATAAPIFLPYDPSFDESSWWNSQVILIELLLATAGDYVVQFNQFKTAQAGIGSDYPRGLQDTVKLDGGYSNIATYLRERVNLCARDRIGMYQVGMGVQTHKCDISAACDSSVDCAVGTGAPDQRNFLDLLECKPL